MITDTHSNADQLATSGPSGLLVDPEWITAHLEDPNVRLVEVVVSPAAYDAGHIPGAVLWNAYTHLRHLDYTPIDSAKLEALLSCSGISPSSTIVFYGYGAYLRFWLMKCYRHDRVLLMDGPRERWGEPVADGASSRRSLPPPRTRSRLPTWPSSHHARRCRSESANPMP